jgi:hypothetical protein
MHTFEDHAGEVRVRLEPSTMPAQDLLPPLSCVLNTQLGFFLRSCCAVGAGLGRGELDVRNDVWSLRIYDPS